MRFAYWVLPTCLALVACSSDAEADLGAGGPPGAAPAPTGASPATNYSTPVDAPKPADTTPPPPPPPRTVAPKLVDLGTVAPGTVVELDVPPNTLGFTIDAEGAAPATWVGVQIIESPGGERVLADYGLGNGKVTAASRIDARDLVASAVIPQTEAASASPPKPGKWKITAQGDGPVHVTAHVQTTSDGKFHGAELDLAVYLADGLVVRSPTTAPHAVTAATAAQDTALAERIDTFYALLKQSFGVDRGKVSFHPAPPSTLAATNPEALNDAFAASKGQPDGQTLNLTLTQELTKDGNPLWGVAPGLPGAAMRTGTTSSNVVLRVTTDDWSEAVMGDAFTVLHESGHFMGLEHTTEYDGTPDPLSDTPTCATITSGDSSACPDLQNLMFPGGDYNGVPAVSAAQKRIVQASPLFHALFEDTPSGGSSNRGVSANVSLARMTFTRSGRPLSKTERWIVSGLCGVHPADVGALVAASRADIVRRELSAIVADTDLPEIVRKNAAHVLTTLP